MPKIFHKYPSVYSTSFHNRFDVEINLSGQKWRDIQMSTIQPRKEWDSIWEGSVNEVRGHHAQ